MTLAHYLFVELEADRENQEGDTELRDEPDPLGIGVHRRHVWPDYHSGNQVAHHQRLMKKLTNDGCWRGDAHHQRHVSKKL